MLQDIKKKSCLIFSWKGQPKLARRFCGNFMWNKAVLPDFTYQWILLVVLETQAAVYRLSDHHVAKEKQRKQWQTWIFQAAVRSSTHFCALPSKGREDYFTKTSLFYLKESLFQSSCAHDFQVKMFFYSIKVDKVCFILSCIS